MIMAFQEVQILTVDTPLDTLCLKELISVIEKNVMQIFIESTDMEVWEILNIGPYAILEITNDEGKEVDKAQD